MADDENSIEGCGRLQWTCGAVDVDYRIDLSRRADGKLDALGFLQSAEEIPAPLHTPNVFLVTADGRRWPVNLTGFFGGSTMFQLLESL
ncbi:hypothetical protein HDIA_2549 [Hartmannibacter diazotrophicus]|uniref:Uncharacterized protein n=1 Tax=Hartmannibacter diazotrophicus TaxID=1482074 RepID=A0A2C9D7B9_9HYPH|nr:hypothetical protein [Hartmannibacter diazotrophicus]SON56090.1 hypothetical protein HDIA_2549 [Hartmannibacter diazotrophicus]